MGKPFAEDLPSHFGLVWGGFLVVGVVSAAAAGPYYQSCCQVCKVVASLASYSAWQEGKDISACWLREVHSVHSSG